MKWLKKLGKFASITALVLFSTLFIYANWNPPRLAHQAKPAYYAAFDLKSPCSEAQKQILEAQVSKMKGVSAVTVNPVSNLAVIAYNPSEVNDPQVFAASINKIANVNASTKKWEIDQNTPQCPANGFLAWLDDVKSVLCVRTR